MSTTNMKDFKEFAEFATIIIKKCINGCSFENAIKTRSCLV